MELDTLGWVFAVLAAISVGLSKGGLPVISGIAVPLLAQVMSPVQAAGLLLPVYIVSDMFGLWAWRKEFDRRVLMIVAPAAVLGIALGWATAPLWPSRARLIRARASSGAPSPDSQASSAIRAARPGRSMRCRWG